MPATIEQSRYISQQETGKKLQQWSNYTASESGDSALFRSVREIKTEGAGEEIPIFDRTVHKETMEVTKRELMMYDPFFDRQRAFAIAAIPDPEIQQREQKLFSVELDLNLNTLLAERLHAGMSRIEYTIKDGLIYGLGSSEPSVDIFKRGQAYTKKNGASISDQAREAAEVETFEGKIQMLFGDEHTPVGTMMLVSSPPGKKGETRYGHNFNDVWVKTGVDTLQLTRFSSALSMEETVERLQEIDASFQPEGEITDLLLMTRPLIIRPGHRINNPDALQKHLHREHETLSLEDFEEVIQLLEPNKEEYKRYVSEHPEDVYGINLRYNAIVNKADFIIRNQKRKKDGQLHAAYYAQKNIQSETNDFGNQRVREVSGWCGSSGGFSTGARLLGMGGVEAMNPFSVADVGAAVIGMAGSDDYGPLGYICPHCETAGVRTHGVKSEPCGNCKRDMC